MSQVSVIIGARNEISAGLADAARDLNKWEQRVRQSASNQAGAFEKENKVKRAFANFSTDILQANSAAEALMATGTALGASLKTSLGTGLIVGGFLALGSAAFTAKTEIEQLAASATANKAKFSNIFFTGSGADAFASIGEARIEVRKLGDELASLETVKGRFKNLLSQVAGGEYLGDRRARVSGELVSSQSYEFALSEMALESQKKQLEIIKLKAAGREAEAKELERTVALEDKLRALDESRLGPRAAEFRELARQQSYAQQDIEDQAELNKLQKEREEAAKRILAIEQQERRQKEEMAELEAKIARDRAEMYDRIERDELARKQRELDEQISASVENANRENTDEANRQVAQEKLDEFNEQMGVGKIGMRQTDRNRLQRAAERQEADDKRRAGREAEREDRARRKKGEAVMTPEEKRRMRDGFQRSIEEDRNGGAMRRHLANIDEIMARLDNTLIKK